MLKFTQDNDFCSLLFLSSPICHSISHFVLHLARRLVPVLLICFYDPIVLCKKHFQNFLSLSLSFSLSLALLCNVQFLMATQVEFQLRPGKSQGLQCSNVSLPNFQIFFLALFGCELRGQKKEKNSRKRKKKERRGEREV